MHRLILAFLLASAFVQGAMAQKSQSAPSQTQGQKQSVQELAEADRINGLVLKAFSEAKYDEALPLAKRVLDIKQRLLSRNDDGVVSAVINLAEIQLARRNLDDSKRLFERALKAYEQSLGPDDLKLANVLDRLALVYYGGGDPEETEKAYKRSLAIRETALGVDHPDVEKSLYQLAEFYTVQEQFKKAEPLYKRVVSSREKRNAPTDSLADALERYACLMRKTKRPDDAEQLEKRSRELLLPHGYMELVITGGVINGKAIDLARPVYPQEARLHQVSGKVVVRVLIDESGKVIRACAIEGPALLLKASETAAYRSRFSPTQVEGKPVKVNGMIVYNFVKY